MSAFARCFRCYKVKVPVPFLATEGSRNAGTDVSSECMHMHDHKLMRAHPMPLCELESSHTPLSWLLRMPLSLLLDGKAPRCALCLFAFLIQQAELQFRRTLISMIHLLYFNYIYQIKQFRIGSYGLMVMRMRMSMNTSMHMIGMRSIPAGCMVFKPLQLLEVYGQYLTIENTGCVLCIHLAMHSPSSFPAPL
jgi:hypothetical protein